MIGSVIWYKLPECIFENCIETNTFQQRGITNQRASNYKITPLTVQCRIQSIV